MVRDSVASFFYHPYLPIADLQTIVSGMQAQGWTFVFLGAGLDAYGESGGIGYSAGSVQAWAPDTHVTRT